MSPFRKAMLLVAWSISLIFLLIRPMRRVSAGAGRILASIVRVTKKIMPVKIGVVLGGAATILAHLSTAAGMGW
jgi:hypothetical protein